MPTVFFLIPLTGKIKTLYPSLWWHQFLTWLVNEFQKSAPHQNERSLWTLAFIWFWIRCVVQLPVLSETEEWKRSSVAERCPYCCLVTCDNRSPRGVNPGTSGQLWTQPSFPQECGVEPFKWESSLWFSKLKPGLFYICLPRVLQLLINFL